MPRTDFTATELQLLEEGFRPFLRLSINRPVPGADWVVISVPGTDQPLVGVELDESADNEMATMTFDIDRRYFETVIDPGIESSPLNNVGTTFYPLLFAGNNVQLQVGVGAIGSNLPIAWRQMFEGYIDEVTRSGREAITVNCRDLLAIVNDAQILEPKTYGVVAGSLPARPLSEIIQEILDDTIGVGVVQLYVETPNSETVPKTGVTVEAGSVLVQIRQLLEGRIGWDIRSRYIPSLGQFRVSLYRRALDINTPQVTLGAHQYTDVSEVREYSEGIINIVRIQWGADLFWEARDVASVRRYGQRGLPVPLTHTAIGTAITTMKEAQLVGRKVLADAAYPASQQTILDLWRPQLQVGDFVRWSANNLHYDIPFDSVLRQVAHRLYITNMETAMYATGRPGAGSRVWDRTSTPDEHWWGVNFVNLNQLTAPEFDQNTVLPSNQIVTLNLSFVRRMLQPGDVVRADSTLFTSTTPPATTSWRLFRRTYSASGALLQTLVGTTLNIPAPGSGGGGIQAALPAGTVRIDIGWEQVGGPAATGATFKFTRLYRPSGGDVTPNENPPTTPTPEFIGEPIDKHMPWIGLA